MAIRLSSTAMMGIPTFLKVSRDLRGLRKPVISAKTMREGRRMSQASEPSPAMAHGLLLAPGLHQDALVMVLAGGDYSDRQG